MTRLEIATLACKILALSLFTQVIVLGVMLVLYFPYAIAKIIRSGEADPRPLLDLATMSVPVIGPLVAGLVLWSMARRLAVRMVVDDPTPVTGSNLSQRDAMAVAFAAVGVFILVPVLRDLARTFIVFSGEEYRFSQWWAMTQWRSEFLSSLIGLVAAIWLIVGSRGLAKLVHRFRTAGDPTQS